MDYEEYKKVPRLVDSRAEAEAYASTKLPSYKRQAANIEEAEQVRR